MQANSQSYTKKQLLDSFKKKQNDKIRELIIQETGVDLFTEQPQEAVNNQQDQIVLDLNEGFFKNKKTFTNSKPTNFRTENNNKNNGGYNDFKRPPLNSRNQEGVDSQKFGRKKENSQPSISQQKEMIPVFQECGFVKDSTIEVWYYKETEEVEGPFNSVDMDSMLFANKITFETKVAFKDPEEKYVRIKKLITITYQDKYNHLLVEPKPVINNDENSHRRGYFKKEFNNSNDNNGNTNFTRGVPRFTKQASDNQTVSGASTRPQFTRSIGDVKPLNNETTQSTQQTSNKQDQQLTTQTADIPQVIKTVEQPQPTQEKAKKETISTIQTPVEQKSQPASTKKEEKPTKDTKKEIKEVIETKAISPVHDEEDLAGFQTVPNKAGGKKKFNKKNATKIVVVGPSEQEIYEEENRKRLEEIRQRDILQQQQYNEHMKKEKKQEAPLKKINYFDEEEEERVQKIIEKPEYFPTLGEAPAQKKPTKPTQNKNKVQVESDEESEKEQKVEKPVPSKAVGNKLVKTTSQKKTGNESSNAKQVPAVSAQKQDPDWIVPEKSNKKKVQTKRAQEESDEEYERQQQQINDQSKYEKLRKQKEQDEKQRLYDQQLEEKRRVEEFQRRQQFNEQEYHSESDEDIDPSDEKSFPTLGGAVYNGPPKNIIHQQQKKGRAGKTNTSAQSKALFNYVKTLEDDAWDAQQKSKPKQPQQKPKSNKLNNDDFPSL